MMWHSVVEKIRGNENVFSSRYQLGILAKPVQSLAGVSNEVCHDARIKDERAHRFIQFSKEFFLLFGKLLSLVPNFSGIEEVGRNLNVAGCHLVDPLWNGHWRTTCCSTTGPRRVISRIAWRQLWRNRGRHPNSFASQARWRCLRIIIRILQVFCQCLWVLQSIFLLQFEQPQVQQRLASQASQWKRVAYLPAQWTLTPYA